MSKHAMNLSDVITKQLILEEKYTQGRTCFIHFH